MNAPAWLENALIELMQRLIILRLPNSPANDTINAVVDVWLEVFMTVRHWDEARDVLRLGAAFASIMATATHWPSPAQVLNAMPPAAPQPMLVKPKPINNPVHIAKCKARINAAVGQVFKKI